METSEVTTDIALFCKGDWLAVLAMAAHDRGGAIIQIDSRNPEPTVALYDNYFLVLEKFDKSIDVSIENGWRCFHHGKPNYG